MCESICGSRYSRTPLAKSIQRENNKRKLFKNIFTSVAAAAFFPLFFVASLSLRRKHSTHITYRACVVEIECKCRAMTYDSMGLTEVALFFAFALAVAWKRKHPNGYQKCSRKSKIFWNRNSFAIQWGCSKRVEMNARILLFHREIIAFGFNSIRLSHTHSHSSSTVAMNKVNTRSSMYSVHKLFIGDFLENDITILSSTFCSWLALLLDFLVRILFLSFSASHFTVYIWSSHFIPNLVYSLAVSAVVTKMGFMEKCAEKIGLHYRYGVLPKHFRHGCDDGDFIPSTCTLHMFSKWKVHGLEIDSNSGIWCWPTNSLFKDLENPEVKLFLFIYNTRDRSLTCIEAGFNF